MRGREREGALSPQTAAADLDALIEELEREVRGVRLTEGGEESGRRTARAIADRFARVSGDRPLSARGRRRLVYNPVKLGVRKLVRWYVEPAFADQRTFNDAMLRLIDDLYERVDRLEAGAGAQADAARDREPERS